MIFRRIFSGTIILSILFGMVIVLFPIKPMKAHALSQAFPDSGLDFNNNLGVGSSTVAVEVSQQGQGNGLQAPASEILLATTDPNPANFHVTINFGLSCAGNRAATFHVLTNDANERPDYSTIQSAANYSVKGDTACTGTISLEALKLVQSNKHTDSGLPLYTATLLVLKGETPAMGVVAFTVGVDPGNYATTQVAPSSVSLSSGTPSTGFGTVGSGSFSLQDRGADNGESTYNIEFANECDVAEGTFVYLHWFDADLVNLADANINFTLFEQPTTGPEVPIAHVDGSTPAGGALFGGAGIGDNGASSDRALRFTAHVGSVYRWQWNNVNRNNGIQFWVPASELSMINGSCNTPDDATCTISPSAFSLSNGQSYSYTVAFKNTGTTTWKNPEYAASSSASTQFPSSDIAPGGTFTLTAITDTSPNALAVRWGQRHSDTKNLTLNK